MVVFSAVQRACGLSRPTIANGIKEIQEHRLLSPGRVRKLGAGRKPAEFHDPKIIEFFAVERIVLLHGSTVSASTPQTFRDK